HGLVAAYRLALRLRGDRRWAQGLRPAVSAGWCYKRTLPLKAGPGSFKRLLGRLPTWEAHLKDALGRCRHLRVGPFGAQRLPSPPAVADRSPRRVLESASSSSGSWLRRRAKTPTPLPQVAFPV